MTNKKIEQCFVLIKPDGVYRSLVGDIISSLSEAKARIVGAKVVSVSKELAEKHYSELKERLVKKFGEKEGNEIFHSTLAYIQGHYHTNIVFALVYEGENCIEKIRKIAGHTNPEEADPQTIRGKYGRINSKNKVFENVIHVSDSPESAKREIQLWFEPEELTSVIYETKKENVSMEKIVWN